MTIESAGLIADQAITSLSDTTHCVESEVEAKGRSPLDARLIRWSWGFVGLGILLRLSAYLMNFPLWWDEAFVAVNLLRRDYLGLLKPLDYGQVCPLFFLWTEYFFVRLMGFHEWSLRLFPLICSIASMILFRHVVRRILEGQVLLLAVAIFAVSVHPIRHAADVKPYATDLLAALIILALAIEWSRRPESPRWLWVMVVICPIALLFSHPSVFVVGGVGVAIGFRAWQTGARNVRITWIAYGAMSIVSYLLIYILFTRNQASAAAPEMKEMWVRSFPPLNSPIDFFRWFAVAHTGDMMAYPCGGEHGASLLSLIACLLGAMTLINRRLWTILGILLAPLGLAIVAAALRLYPYGGPAPHGSSARIMQYAAPALCLLIGLGASRLLDRVRTVSTRDRLLKLTCVGLFLIGVVPQVASLRHPYRAYQAEAARHFAREFWPELGRNAEVADLRWDYAVADWDSIHLGIAVSLCNEAIYSPARRNRGPRVGDVSQARPLRCVLGVAPEVDSPRITAWLESMRHSYDLRKRETIRVPITEPNRRLEYESYEVFEFVPRPNLDD